MRDTEEVRARRQAVRLGVDLLTLLALVVIAIFMYVEISILRGRDALFDQLRREHSVILEAARRCGQ